MSSLPRLLWKVLEAVEADVVALGPVRGQTCPTNFPRVNRTMMTRHLLCEMSTAEGSLVGDSGRI